MLICSQCNAPDGRGRGDACVAPTVSGPRGRVFGQREIILETPHEYLTVLLSYVGFDATESVQAIECDSLPRAATR